MQIFESKPVVVSGITLTRPTQKALNLNEGDFDVLMSMELTQSQKDNLTVKVAYKQQRENYSVQPAKAADGSSRRQGIFALTEIMGSHDNFSSAERFKYDWTNSITLTALAKIGLSVGCDVSAVTGKLAFILNENMNVPVMVDKRIISSPKRQGKNGPILLDEYNRLIFQTNTLVSNGEAEFKDFDYQKFVEFEIASQTKYTNVIPVEDVPVESKTSGFFSTEFESWLAGYYTKTGTATLSVVA